MHNAQIEENFDKLKKENNSLKARMTRLEKRVAALDGKETKDSKEEEKKEGAEQ